jgi:hypothetical protein
MEIASITDVPVAKYRAGERIRVDLHGHEFVGPIVRVELVCWGHLVWVYGFFAKNLNGGEIVNAAEHDIKGLEGEQP